MHGALGRMHVLLECSISACTLRVLHVRIPEAQHFPGSMHRFGHRFVDHSAYVPDAAVLL